MSGIGLSLGSGRRAATDPVALTNGKVVAFLAPALASDAGSGQAFSLPDALANNPAVQSTDARKVAVGSASNGRPIVTFAGGNDVLSWPQTALNNSTTKTGFLAWIKPAAVIGVQYLCLAEISASGNCMNANKFALYLTGNQLRVECNITNANGRFFTTSAATIVAGAWQLAGFTYDSSQSGEANICKMLAGGAYVASPGGNLGAGGTIAAFQATTGNFLLGNSRNDGTPASPYTGDMGNAYVTAGHLASDELANLAGFQVPT